MGGERIFFQGEGQLQNFLVVAQRIFLRGAKVVKFLYTPETKETFFA